MVVPVSFFTSFLVVPLFLSSDAGYGIIFSRYYEGS